MTAYWDTVRAAVHRGLREYALAYLIPANGILGYDREQQRKLADTWGELASPHITACIREDVRRSGEDELDWRDIALRLFKAPESDRSLLSTTVRDAVEAEVAGENERGFGVGWDRGTDAATGLEGR